MSQPEDCRQTSKGTRNVVVSTKRSYVTQQVNSVLIFISSTAHLPILLPKMYRDFHTRNVSKAPIALKFTSHRLLLSLPIYKLSH